VSIKTTALYQELRRRIPDIPAGPRGLLDEFDRLRGILQEHGKYIVSLFPEYTPHDHTRHLDHLFALADRILGTPLYTRLGASELVLLAFGLYAHDWGMAVSEAERQVLLGGTSEHGFVLLPEEPARAQEFISDANLAGISPEVVWRDYLRRTHGHRSGARLRNYLEPLGAVFADAVAKIAEGHTLDLREVRDTHRYPLSLSVFGDTVNLAALTTYVRMIDLLDIGEDRTPYALWKFVAPADAVSSMEWQKHRALSPVSVKPGSVLREIVISGRTDDPAVFAALADLQSWVDEQFAMSITQLRTISGKYDLDLDSRINWGIDASGFEPLSVRFEIDRAEVLGLLSGELYKDDPLAFIRELLQNSVDAIDMREALLVKQGLTLKGEIKVRIRSSTSGVHIDWSDNGIGMDEDVLSGYFAKLGRSWYRSREASQLGKIEAISGFGVGVLSYFAVSHKLAIETRRDPQAGGSPSGFIIDIPARESHFRIRTTTNIPVGTTIRLEVPPSLTTTVSNEAICEALSRVARYVRHRIVIDSDTGLTEIGHLGKKGGQVVSGAIVDDLNITILGMRGDSAEKISTTTTKVSFELGNPVGEYHGHYSTIVPKMPGEARENIDYMGWTLEGERIDLGGILTDTEQVLYVKGVQAGPVIKRRRFGEETLTLVRYTPWINPKLHLNVQHPSYLKFNLSRSSVQLVSRDWLISVWQDIARKLRASVFNWPLTSATDTAILLGSCAVFGGVPDYGLDTLIERDDIPLLLLRAGEGFVWSSIEAFAQGESFIEAPFELGYILGGLSSFGEDFNLDGWEGDHALFPTESFTSKRFPWLGATLAYGHRELKRLGWCPTEICLVRSPANETLPLVCRVWRNRGVVYDEVDSNDKWYTERQRKMEGWQVLKNLYEAAPDILNFPESIAEYAAIGSRYWNISHPKIVQVISTLTELKNRWLQQRLSANGWQRVAYLRSNQYYGYIVPSCYSDTRLALELPNHLLDIAEEEGLGHTERLVSSDFFPGTTEGYRSPHHLGHKEWQRRGTGLGQRLD
jgi:hypothetical protein